jgi:hypothetical protein
MVRSIWLALYFLISLCALAALKASIALMPTQEALLPVSTATAASEQDLPLAKSDRLPLPIIEQAPIRYFAGGAAATPPTPAVPDETKSTAEVSFAAPTAPGDRAVQTSTNTTQRTATSTKTTANRPWRNAYAEKRHHHRSASKRQSRRSYARAGKQRKT